MLKKCFCPAQALPARRVGEQTLVTPGIASQSFVVSLRRPGWPKLCI